MNIEKIKIWVLAPFLETTDPNLEYYYDYTQSQKEYEKVFAELALDWQWQPVTIHNFKHIIDGIQEGATDYLPVIFNLCDGDDINDVPGVSVIRYLTETNMVFTGSDTYFYDITTSKIPMKKVFDAHQVPTPDWEVVDVDGDNIKNIFARLGAPLILKPAISAGSMGVTLKSVVDTEGALSEQVALLNKGYRGWELTGGGLFVEQFIAGYEFTTFITGYHDDEANAHIYQPIERVFNKKLPPKEQFLSFDRLWEFYEDETPIGDYETLWDYDLPPAAFVEDIKRISWAAYEAVKGVGYGRVDLRMDKETQKIYVLEVNAQCGISEDEDFTSIGGILRLTGKKFTSIIQEIIENTLTKKGYSYKF